MEILLVITYTLFFIFLICKVRFFDAEGISKRFISGVFIIKIISGTLLWGVYTFYYKDHTTADIYKYFDDSKILYDALQSNPLHYFKMLFGIGNNVPEFDTYYSRMNYWSRKYNGGVYNDSHTIIRFNAFIRILSLGYYNVHTVFICFLSLIGLTAIYKTFAKYLDDKKKELGFVVFFLPSVLFWGSGVLKEGLILFALGLLVYIAQQKVSVKVMLIFITAGLLLALSKFYVWLGILPGLLFLFWIKKTSIKRTGLKFFLVFLVLALAALNIDRFTGIQNPLVTLSQKQIEFNQLASGEMLDAGQKKIPVAGSAIVIDKLQPTFLSLLKNSPQAFFNVLFRPYLWEARSPFILMAALENGAILFFIMLCLIYRRPFAVIRWEYVLFCLSFVMIQFLIIGETVPVLGAIARYKVPALPFLLIAFLFLLDKQQLTNRLAMVKKTIFKRPTVA